MKNFEDMAREYGQAFARALIARDGLDKWADVGMKAFIKIVKADKDFNPPEENMSDLAAIAAHTEISLAF